jgi:hypothetical protein
MSEAHQIAMNTQPDTNRQATVPSTVPAEPTSNVWAGWATFAGIMMIMIGVFHAIAGLVALFNTTYYTVPNTGLVLTVSYYGWGWLHIIGGVLVFLAGLGLLAGKTWARVVAVILAGLSALANLAFLPAWPIWSIIVIALDVVVIYALTVHGKELEAA